MWAFLKVKGVRVPKRFKTSLPTKEKSRSGKIKDLAQRSHQSIRAGVSSPTQPVAPSGQQSTVGRMSINHGSLRSTRGFMMCKVPPHRPGQVRLPAGGLTLAPLPQELQATASPPALPSPSPLIPKRGEGWRAKKNLQSGIDLPKAKATQRLCLFPWRRDQAKQRSKTVRNTNRHHLPGQRDRCWRARARTGRHRKD